MVPCCYRPPIPRSALTLPSPQLSHQECCPYCSLMALFRSHGPVTIPPHAYTTSIPVWTLHGSHVGHDFRSLTPVLGGLWFNIKKLKIDCQHELFVPQSNITWWESFGRENYQSRMLRQEPGFRTWGPFVIEISHCKKSCHCQLPPTPSRLTSPPPPPAPPPTFTVT